MKNFDEILEKYRQDSISEHDKGTRFEVLMKNFLLTYPQYRGKFSEVWLWKDFPFRAEFGGKDLGIDIVAKTFDGEFWAVQCKCYAETSTIDKPAVDSFLATSSKTFNGQKFSARLWISTTNNFTDNAEKTLQNQSPPVTRLGLEELRDAAVDWEKLDAGIVGDDAIIKRELRDYQLDAVNAAAQHFQTNSRGQLIMACGTGKTFTALKIAERLTNSSGKILFLVPSIALLAQTLDEWATYAENPIDAICICSDSTATQKFEDDAIDVNLPLPAMTDSKKILVALKNLRGDGMTVIFSTYHSIDVVKDLHLTFDLTICDEAHRTTGSSKDLFTQFTKVHDENFIKSKRRLYMTATPRLYSSSAKDRSNEQNFKLWSMDDENIFGKEFFSISFKQAIDKGCLSDYKVLVLTIHERSLRKSLLEAIHDKNNPIKVDDALKLVGCINALSKRTDEKSIRLLKDDPNLMHTAVAFCSRIKDSKKFCETFPDVQRRYKDDLPADVQNSFVNVHWAHVDGSTKSSERDKEIYRLKETPQNGNTCNIISNVRCLSLSID